MQGSGSALVTISGSTTDLETWDAVTPDVDNVSITCTSSGIGLDTEETSRGSYKDVDISGGSYGFKAYFTAAHTFREGSVTGWSRKEPNQSGHAGFLRGPSR